MSQQQAFIQQQGSPITPNIEFLQGNTGGPVGPNPATFIINVVGDTVQGVSVNGNPVTYTQTITVADATATQKGVVLLEDPTKFLVMEDDFNGAFYSSTINGTIISNYAWWSQSVDTEVNTGVTVNNPGTIANDTSGEGQDWTVRLGDGLGMILGGGAIDLTWIAKTAILSNGTERYLFSVGLGDSAGATIENGVYFSYEDDINSGNFTINCTNATVTTSANTAVAAIDSAFINFRILINAAGTSAQFFINGVSVGTIATNLPTSAITATIKLYSVLGTTAPSSVIADLFKMKQTLTVQR